MSMGDHKEKVAEVEKELENFKSSINAAVNDLKRDVSEIKNSIIDLRTTISELENPFNLLKAFTGEEDLAKHFKAEDAAETKRGIENETAERGETKPVMEEPKREEAIPALSACTHASNFEISLSLVKWVWTLLDMGFDENDVKKLSTYCEFFGLLPKGSSGYVSEVSSTVKKARILGLSEEILALGMYGAAKASGLKSEFEDITQIVFNALRKFMSRPERNLFPDQGGQ
ncbi:MAG: hypothetical protein ACTSXC_07155 [Candidatus Freyarchaeota archaeon]